MKAELCTPSFTESPGMIQSVWGFLHRALACSWRGLTILLRANSDGWVQPASQGSCGAAGHLGRGLEKEHLKWSCQLSQILLGQWQTVRGGNATCSVTAFFCSDSFTSALNLLLSDHLDSKLHLLWSFLLTAFASRLLFLLGARCGGARVSNSNILASRKEKIVSIIVIKWWWLSMPTYPHTPPIDRTSLW